ncbi:hypothetical protein ACFPFP_05185 [Bradyrhizobium sp. GCM10023182]|uniref:Muconolactone isomerase domain-containing protein n=1 Tax=Bradyrhizobium zhengyangense TaxID=2911009 RepID=A0ABS9LH38_9BRAD|nr:hypothetical protein [Bradyrhizobium zhengyangense]MCG2666322.1 hypothetical protein [Bradyrhizobium zhengyangense]
MTALKRPMGALRSVVVAFVLALTGGSLMTIPAAAQTQTQSQTQAAAPAVTGVFVILTVKQGVAREQVMAVLPAEIRATVQLYLGGKIREWYSRGDGRGVVLLLDTRDVAEAQAIMDGLPLGQAHLMDHDYIPVGPLQPLGLLMANPVATKGAQ